MNLYAWLLFLHVLAAFVLVAGLVSFAALLSGTGGEPARRALAGPASALWSIGGVGVLVLGIWLAFEVDGYEPWDSWIVIAIVLWLVASAAGGPLSRGLRGGVSQLAPRRARLLLGVSALATLLLLADMMFKPGAG